MKKFLAIIALILLTTAVILTAYFGNHYKKNDSSKKASGSLIKHLKIEPEIIDREAKVPVILFHYVRNIAPYPDKLGWSLSVPPSTFQEQMEYLVKENYTTITPNDLYQYLQYGTPLPKKPIILTFDDGYLDFFEEVFPLLRDLQLKATNFITTSFIGRENYLDWYHLNYLVSSGRVFIGNHSQTHANLAEIPSEQLEQEISVSKTDLEESLDTEINCLAYPNGNYNDNVLSILKENKFKIAFTTENGNLHKTTELLKLPRIKIGGSDSVQSFADKLK